MTRLSRLLSVAVVLAVALGSAADADAKRKKKKRKKKRRKAKTEQVVTPEAEVPIEAPPEAPGETSSAGAGEAPAETPNEAAPPPSDEASEQPGVAPSAPSTAPPEAAAATAPPPEPAAPTEPTMTAAPPEAEPDVGGVPPDSEAAPPTAGEMEILEAAPAGAGAGAVGEAEISTAGEPSELFGLTGAIKIGTVIPSVYSSLDPALFGTIELGYLLPFLGQRLAVVADFSYSRPERISRYDFADPRLPGDGSYRFYFTEDQYSIGLGLLARVFPPKSPDLFGLNFYGKLTGRLELQHAAEGARAVEAFGRNEETATRGAIFFAGGAELALGPGAVLVEVSFAWAPLEHELTGDADTGGLGVVAGYAFLFGGS